MLRKLTAVYLATAATAAASCPDGYYEACFVACGCLPNSGTVTSSIPLPVPNLPPPYVPPVFSDIKAAISDLTAVIRDNLAKGVDALKQASSDAEKQAKDLARNTVSEVERFGQQLVLAGDSLIEFQKAQLSGQANNINATLQAAREGRVVDALWTSSVQSLRITEQNAGKAALRSEYLRAVGQVAAGAYGGPSGTAAYAAWLAYKQTGDADLALRVGIITAASGYAMQGAGQIDDSVRKAIVIGAIGGASIAAAGGTETAVLQGFVKGAAMVVIQDGYKSFTSHKLTGESATKEFPYCLSGQTEKCTPLPPGAIVGKDANGNLVLDRSKLDPLVPAVGLQDPSAFWNESNPVMQGLSRVPGVNAMAFLHDEWVAKWDLGALATPITIVPAIVITYAGLGVPLIEDIGRLSIESSLDRVNPGGTSPPPPTMSTQRPQLPNFQFVSTPNAGRYGNVMHPIDAVMCTSKTGKRFGALLVRSFGPKFCSEGQIFYKTVTIGINEAKVLQCLKKPDNWGSFTPNPHSSCAVHKINVPKESTVGQEPAFRAMSSVLSFKDCVKAYEQAVPDPLPSGASCIRARSNRPYVFNPW